MKRSMIIALFAVLVLSVFTACNGDVNADMVDKKTITLHIKDDNSVIQTTFEDGKKTLTVTIPDDCETWGSLVGKCSITIKWTHSQTHGTEILSLISSGDNPDDSVYFRNEGWVEAHIDSLEKSAYRDVTNNTAIVVGETYDLYMRYDD